MGRWGGRLRAEAVTRCPPVQGAAGRLAAAKISLIDLNFGCPERRIMGKQGAGATLLRDPATVGELVTAAVQGVGDVPVTAKIRLGPSLE